MIERNSIGSWEFGVGLGGGNYPSDNFVIQDLIDGAVRFSIDGSGKAEILGLQDIGVLLSTTTVSLAADGDTTIYTVPTGKTLIPTKAVLVAGASAGATSRLSIGQNGAETDFAPVKTLSHLTAIGDYVEIKPYRCIYLEQLGVPVKSKRYAAGTVLQAQVSNQSGGASNTLYLFGILL